MDLLRLSRRSVPCASPIVVLLFQGCATTPSLSEQRVHVESEPSGANVYVMGRMVGHTPIHLDQGQVFPLTYSADQEQAYGKVVLRKAGCGSHEQRVSAVDVSNGIRAKLECGNALAPRTRAEPGHDAASPKRPGDEAPAGPSVRSRLLRLNRLREDGLITEREYRETRQRILDEL